MRVGEQGEGGRAGTHPDDSTMSTLYIITCSTANTQDARNNLCDVGSLSRAMLRLGPGGGGGGGGGATVVLENMKVGVSWWAVQGAHRHKLPKAMEKGMM